jgi:DNA-binding winged helix-turn-helix (wHTH) protein
MSLSLAKQQERWLAVRCDNSSIIPHPRSPASGAALEFGRFRVLLRERQLLADGIPVEIGTRAFDLLVALLEADGSLLTKSELLSYVWPGIVVSEENLKVQICALRRVFGGDRDLIRTEFGRGYRFTADVHLVASRGIAPPAKRQTHRSPRSPRRRESLWRSHRNRCASTKSYCCDQRNWPGVIPSI